MANSMQGMSGADQGGSNLDAGPDSSAGPISVTITDNGDGTYAVAMGQGDDAAQDSGDSSDQSKQADNLIDALEMAGELLSAAGGADGSADDGDSGDDADDGQDDSAPMSPGDAKSYWRQMAARKKFKGPM